MAVTRNGWDIIDDGSSDRLVPLQWITGKVRKGDAHTILNDLGTKFNKIEKITKAHSWGYAKRPVRGYADIPSEHSTGTAVDFNAPAHPIGKKNTFNIIKRARIRKLVKSYDGAVRWGGEWARPDDMHFELIGGAAKIKQVADKLSGVDVKPVGTIKPVTPSKPAVTPPKALPKAVQTKLKAMKLTPDAAGVKAFQKQHGLWIDGKWEAKTEAKYKANVKLQKALNLMRSTTLKVVVDGYIGDATNKRIDNVLYRNKWTRSNLVANLKKVKAYK